MATIKVEQNCGRCGKANFIATDSAEGAQLLLSAHEKKAARVKQLVELINSFPAHEVPDLFTVQRVNGASQTYSYEYLCASTGEGSRACSPKVASILKGVAPRAARGPRGKKAATKAKAVAVTPAKHATA